MTSTLAAQKDPEAWGAETAKRQWMKKHGLTLATRSEWGWWRLLGKRGRNGGLEPPEGWPYSLPADDHVSLWLRDGKPAVWVSQPYGVSSMALGEIRQHCLQFGLECAIRTWPAWHYPGHVLMLEWTVTEP